MTLKKCKVVMLPTNQNKATQLCFGDNNKYLFNTKTLKENWQFIHKWQHLYIISDEEIKEGDWVIMLDDYGKVFSTPQQWLGIGVLNKNLRKIIATTDNSLIITDYVDCEYPLPQPSQSFMKKYIESYNNGNPIIDVMAECYEGCISCGRSDGYSNTISNCSVKGRCKFQSFLKINQKDNTITIKRVKDNWNREEVLTLIDNYISEKENFGIDRDKWIEENL